jgi:hypothetical protein
MTLAAAFVALLLAVGCGLGARRARRRGFRRAWLAGLGATGATTLYLLVAAAVLPRTLWPAQYLTLDGSSRAELHVPDPDLGYVLTPSTRVRGVRRDGDAVLYDVVYTIGADGLRVTSGDPSGVPIVFYGCSFTFGEGVADDETLPSRVSEALGSRAHVVNRGVGGYGPHQMLRALEIGRDQIAPGARVFYQAIGDHVRRVAGKAPWDDLGPRYALDGSGVRWTGPLHSPRLRLLRRAAAALAARGFLPTRVFGYEVSDDERELYVRIVAAAAQRARAAGGRFTVIFWDDTPGDTALAGLLETRGLEVWRVSGLLPGIDRGALLIAQDGHPGPELYRLLGAAVAARLEAETPSVAAPAVLGNHG